MALQVRHTFNSAKADGADPTLIQPSHWNADHQIVGTAGGPLYADNVNGVQVLTVGTAPGNFATIQAALDSILPGGNRAATEIRVTGHHVEPATIIVRNADLGKVTVVGTIAPITAWDNGGWFNSITFTDLLDGLYDVNLTIDAAIAGEVSVGDHIAIPLALLSATGENTISVDTQGMVAGIHRITAVDTVTNTVTFQVYHETGALDTNVGIDVGGPGVVIYRNSISVTATEPGVSAFYETNIAVLAEDANVSGLLSNVVITTMALSTATPVRQFTAVMAVRSNVHIRDLMVFTGSRMLDALQSSVNVDGDLLFSPMGDATAGADSNFAVLANASRLISTQELGASPRIINNVSAAVLDCGNQADVVFMVSQAHLQTPASGQLAFVWNMAELLFFAGQNNSTGVNVDGVVNGTSPGASQSAAVVL